MPVRFLKPGITSSEPWNACSWQSQSFYIRLITLVDDFGRMEANPKLLRSLAFPLMEDIRSTDVLKLMHEISDVGLVIFYKAPDGKDYLQISRWTERPRAEHSKYPAFDNSCKQLFSSDGECCGQDEVDKAADCECSLPSSSSSSSTPPYGLFADEKPEWVPDETQTRLNALFRRRPTTRWSSREIRAYRELGKIEEEDMSLLITYYRANIPKDSDYRRRDLLTLLNNFRGEVDRARNFKPSSNPLF